MKINIFKYLFFVILVFLIVLAVYLLYKDKKEETVAIENTELEINMVNEFNIGIIEYDTMNPILSANRDIQYIDKLIFNSLVDISKDFKIINSLAKEVSKVNSLTYIIKLNEDINWHDGTKFMASDVIFTIDNLKKNNIKSIYKENLKDVQEVIKIDDYTIKIVLKEEVPFFEYMLCFPIIAEHAYDAKTLVNNTEVPIGTGKFKISKIEENKIEIVRNNIDSDSKIYKINILVKNNTNNLYSSLSKEEVDIIITDNVFYEEYLGTMGYNVNSSCGREFEYLVLNNKISALSNKEVRQAIAYSIDRNVINYNNYNNKYNISNYPLMQENYLYEELAPMEYDINKAKNILIENGWTYKNNVWIKSKTKLQLDLIVNVNNEKRVNVAENIKEQLSKIGILVDVVKVNDTMYNYYIKNKNYDMILLGNVVSNNPNLETYFGTNNLSNYSNEEVLNDLIEIKDIDSEELLKEKYKKIQSIYDEEIPFVPLYFNNIFLISSTKLKGDLSHNWYNLFYNIDNWYKIRD